MENFQLPTHWLFLQNIRASSFDEELRPWFSCRWNQSVYIYIYGNFQTWFNGKNDVINKNYNIQHVEKISMTELSFALIAENKHSKIFMSILAECLYKKPEPDFFHKKFWACIFRKKSAPDFCGKIGPYAQEKLRAWSTEKGGNDMNFNA